MKISVIIPTYNRAKTILRAINSALSQTVAPYEIIIIDDYSTDNTYEMINNFKENSNINIIYKKNPKQIGGAGCRNIGADIATGDYFAFLDSDDEWRSNHLELMCNLIKKRNLDGAYSTFILDYGNAQKEMIFSEKSDEISMATYIFKGIGDTRTSTFILKRDSFMDIRFDENLKKHQDWDFAIRFDHEKKFGMNIEPTVILHVEGLDRMSKKMNHEASAYFISKNKILLSETSLTYFYYNLVYNTLQIEGKNDRYKFYLKEMKKYKKKSKVRDFKVDVIPFLNKRIIDSIKKLV